MTDFTECPVCFEEYQNPRILPCSHTLCAECLEIMQKQRDGQKFITCPLCQTAHKIPRRGAGSFPENQHAIQLIVERKVKSIDFFLNYQQYRLTYVFPFILFCYVYPHKFGYILI